MSNGVIGLNILADRQFAPNALIGLVKQLQPAYCVVLNSPALAAQLVPLTTVIHRRYPDDDAQNNQDPFEFITARHNEAPPGAYLYAGNEPGKSAAAKLNQWTLDCQARAAQLGRKLCILNWATGNPEPPDWDTVAPCIQNAVKRGDLIGAHEYWLGTPNQSPSYPYYVGRCFDAVKRFGGKWVITETGANKQKDGTNPPQPDPWAGWLTFRNEQAYADDASVIAPMYAERGIGVCYFSYPEWDGHGFDVSQATGVLHPRWIALNAKYPLGVTPVPPIPPTPVYPPGTNPRPSRVQQPSGVTLRAEPTTSAAKVMVIPFDAVVTEYLDPTAPDPKYHGWHRVDYQGMSGWCALFIDGRDSFIPVTAPAPLFRLKNPVGCAHIISAKFGVPRDYDGDGVFEAIHEGLDVTRAHADCTPLILNGHDGIVSDVSATGAYGLHVKVKSTVGVEYTVWYCHMAYIFDDIAPGKAIAAGHPIGIMGTSGNSTGVHLHLNVQKDGAPTPAGSVVPSVIDPDKVIDW